MTQVIQSQFVKIQTHGKAGQVISIISLKQNLAFNFLNVDSTESRGSVVQTCLNVIT